MNMNKEILEIDNIHDSIRISLLQKIREKKRKV